MPTYECECKKCNKTFEIFQSIKAEKLKNCPECGSEIKRLLGTGSGLVFKGTGWYVTDFKNKGGGKPDSSKTTTVPAAPSNKEAPSAPKETTGPKTSDSNSKQGSEK